MLGTYPIFINGEETGTLTVGQEGLMTVFEARCADPGELLRLSVYGEKEGYLGVMMPDGAGNVELRKRLSRAALEGFPREPRFAGPAGQGAAALEQEMPSAPAEQQAAPSVRREPALEKTPAAAEREPAPEKEMPSASEKEPVSAAEAETAPETEASPEPKDAMESVPEEAAEPVTLWRHSAGGALLGMENGRRLLAVPLREGVTPNGGRFEKRSIDGADYAVFEIRNGRIVQGNG